MTIIVFLIDNTPSMAQRCFAGPTFLDLAKGAVETFLKYRCRDLAGKVIDRYMLLTFDEFPKNVKVGWKESQTVLTQELKNLKTTGNCSIGQALGNVFQMLNVNRLTSGVDYFGYGRYPSFMEPAIILLVTDGCHLNTVEAQKNELEVVRSTLPGFDLYNEPHRWDQRVYGIILRIPGQALKPSSAMNLVSDIPPVETLCRSTGGRSFRISNTKMLNSCMDFVVQKLQTGVVVQLEKIGSDPVVNQEEKLNNGTNINFNNISAPAEENKLMNHVVENGFIQQNCCDDAAINKKNKNVEGISILKSEQKDEAESGKVDWRKTKQLVYVPKFSTKVQCHWPLPESFYPEISLSVLPPRSAHPLIKFKCTSCEPLLMNDIPYDKYELEPSPLTQYILSLKQPNVCWQIYAPNSIKSSDLGQTFGYLKAATGLNCVNLIVLPYNYPTLFQLLDELRNSLKQRINTMWKAKFDKYMQSIPPYYFSPLKKVLPRINANILPEISQSPCIISYSVSTYLCKAKQLAKDEWEKLCQAVAQYHQLQQQTSANCLHTGLKVLSTLVNVPKVGLNDSDNKKKKDGINVNEFSNIRVHFALKSKATSRTMAPNFDSKQTTKLTSLQSDQPDFGCSATALLSRLDEHLLHTKPAQQFFRNPFDVPRSHLLQQIRKMQANLNQLLDETAPPPLPGGKPGTKLRFQDVEELHRLPILQMGTYQEYLRCMPPGLKPLETPPVRQHAFGNPFKVDKRMLVDEADIVDIGMSSPSSSGSSTPTSGGPSNYSMANNMKIHKKKMNDTNSNSQNQISLASNSVHNDDDQLIERSPPSPYRIAVLQKRKPGPLPRDFNYRKKKRLDEISSLASTSPKRLDEVSDMSDVDSDMECMSDRSSSSLDLDFPSLSIDTSGPDENENDFLTGIGHPAFIDDQKPSNSENLGDNTSTTYGNGAPDHRRKEKRPTRVDSTEQKMDEDMFSRLKAELSRLIRRPRIDKEELYTIVDKISGLMKIYLAHWLHEEALRFRRHSFASEVKSRYLKKFTAKQKTHDDFSE